ncbi:DNA adenine methylase [Methylorubrum populi]|jgi:adenine-specific DNA-methyltransferase|uniref:DNA adenine methylase n=1 Tax=Methylorubrum populi TaxID=223967 RepID=UPI000DB4B067|nr:DNA adenine methylase [Methylorubrum populi]PZP69445.1 MAG: hypothetical protein DI590_14290 [Methylorubrum populi]
MLQRYIGNKNALIQELLAAVQPLAAPGDLVCDAFSGSVAVSVALKSAGYRVATNDINLLSWVFAIAYLKNSSLPALDMPALLGGRTAKSTKTGSQCNRIEDWSEIVEHLIAAPSSFESKIEWRQDFFDYYCEEGAKSSFLSSRGKAGRRRFFTAANAKAIDRALSRIRYWWRANIIDENVRCLLTARLLDGIEKRSNTQGTYHDFPRDFYDSRALRPLCIEVPETSLMQGRSDHIVGKAEDSLEFVRRVPDHAVLYLDPPYNFRQYTSYYFLPNIVARYPDIDSLDDYFANVKFVRGQNMDDDFTSSFCKSAQFISSLERIIMRSRCRHVVMSYFDGKNHWGSFKAGPDGQGRKHLEEFFKSSIFVPGTMRCIPVERLNYQSYGGYQAKSVSEYIFIAEKARKPHSSRKLIRPRVEESAI